MPNLPATRRADLTFGLVAIALAVLAFANALHGGFVYDDARQIVKNAYIQDPAYFGKALLSDVWAFKGEAGQAWSNYWRPTFVLWLMGNFHAFGLASTLPWHVALVGLHALVVLLAFVLARRMQGSAALAGTIAVLFAVHPAHVESIAWLSGAPDPLLALAALACLLLVLRARATHERTASAWLMRVGALICAALAMGAKEVGIVLPALVFAAVATHDPQRTLRSRLRDATLESIPYALLATAYFFVRLQLLGEVTRANAPGVGLVETVLTAPSLLAFYLRQCLLPLWIGPSYPLRVVEPGALSATNFWLPLLLCLLFAAFAFRVLRRGGAVQRFGLALFALTLLPAFNIAAFMPEQLVHDRYLYLPLLGLLMAIVPELAAVLSARLPARRAQAAAATMTVLAATALLAATLRYNRAWADEFSFWEASVASDPTSSYNWAHRGLTLKERGRPAEAEAALRRALEHPVDAALPTALIVRAQLAREAKRFDEAERDLRRVIESNPSNVVAYEELSVTLRSAGRLQDAANVLESGRQRVPHYACAFTTNLAVVLYLARAKAEALAQLEAIRPRIDGEANALCKQALFRLAQLYAEQGRNAESRAALEHYLVASATYGDAGTQTLRMQARQALASLPR
jgi:tetratricopeptide (TPR) repeat protein